MCFQDTGQEIDKLCSFLGLSLSAELKEMVVSGVQFENMKNNQMASYSTFPAMNFRISSFLRKGLKKCSFSTFSLFLLMFALKSDV